MWLKDRKEVYIPKPGKTPDGGKSQATVTPRESLQDPNKGLVR
jgi:hypothetical protein